MNSTQKNFLPVIDKASQVNAVRAYAAQNIKDGWSPVLDMTDIPTGKARTARGAIRKVYRTFVRETHRQIKAAKRQTKSAAPATALPAEVTAGLVDLSNAE